MLAGIDQSVAHPMLERNAPLPSGIMRRGAGVGIGRAGKFALRRDCPVARQPVRPVLIAAVERLLDEQSAKARAIDEQIPFENFAAFERHGFDETGLGRLGAANDLALAAANAV